MSSPLAASHPDPSPAEQVSGVARLYPGRVLAGVRRLVDRVPLTWRLSAVAALGALAAAGVAATVAANPLASPPRLPVELRVAIIGALIVGGLYAQTSRIQARMGGLLIGAGFVSALWLLNGSANRLLFSIGVLVSGVAPVLFAYLLLAHPAGRLSSRREAQFVWLTGGVLAALWLLGVLMTLQPPLATPLLRCAPRCIPNAFSFGSANHPIGVIQVAMRIAWLGLTLGTPLLLIRRVRGSPTPLRRALIPVTIVGSLMSAVLVAYTAAKLAGAGAAGTLGTLYVACAALVPIAILAGLGRERLFMGQTLAEIVNQLARVPQADPEALMAAALRDPSLRIAYRRPASGTYVDSHGAPVSDFGTQNAVAWIERDGQPVAAVLYAGELAHDERFVKAAGAAALFRLEKVQLEADLRASAADIAASRIRLLEMAHAERRRLERDLHDGVQQNLVGLRLKLEMAAEAIKDDPAQGERVLALVGQQMDDILDEVRSLARGIYPSLLSERGVGEALRAAARSSPVPAEVRGRVGRYGEDLEVAVYYCCLEALQNVAKHAGSGATATVTLREEEGRLGFEVRDTGVGFSPRTAAHGSGLINMHDRIEAVGGAVEVTSRRGRGTAVRGSVPIG